MTDHDSEHKHHDHHGKDAADKPEDGAKSDDNPEFGKGTGEGEAGFTQTGAQGGAHPTEPHGDHDVAEKRK